MTINDAITKLRVMLGAEEPVQEVKNEEATEETKVAMAEATLVDGTVVTTEGELVPGAILYVKVEEGAQPFAPEGQHETTEGLIVTVGENGEVISVEEKAEEAEPVAEEAPEAPVAEEMKEEAPVAETFNAEELLTGVAEIIKPYAATIEELTNKLNVLEERFEAVADTPGAAPVKRNFMEDARASKAVQDARFDRLAKLRNSNK